LRVANPQREENARPAGAVGLGSAFPALRRAVAAARQRSDAEATHALRVCLARVRTWLWLGGHAALDGDARWLRKSAGPLRDLDVKLEPSPPKARAASLRRQRPAARAALIDALAAPRTQAFLGALARLPPVPRKVAHQRLRQLARRALEAEDAVRWSTPELEAVHALRRAVRRVRYALESLGGKTGKLTDFQSALGDACDCLVAEVNGVEEHLTRARKQWPKVRRRLERLAKNGK
jgi:CHAD domain-containing protein